MKRLTIALVSALAVLAAFPYRGYQGPKSLVYQPSVSAPPTRVSTSTYSIAPENIRNANFELLQVSKPITFEEALAIANRVASTTKIRPAFLLAITQEELALEKTDMCYVTNLKTGEGIRPTDGAILKNTMDPKHDIPAFLKITRALGKDPLQTLVTCPMSFGTGGAMGPADFIPSTWLLYKKQIEKITGKPADPWSVEDAFLAAGLFLSDVGAKSQTRDAEWKAAMIYFSGSAKSPHTFYADGAMNLADALQKDIENLPQSSF